jgi:hypothetical protein
MKSSLLLRKGTLALAIGCGFATSLALLTPPAFGQSNVSGDIAGVVTDPSGAAVPGATVVVKDLANGTVKTVTSDGSGNYRVSLLKPDMYSLTITAAGFETVTSQVNVTPGQIASGNAKLTVGNNSQTVEVTETAPLLHTESADLTTSFSQQAVQNLPNPGNDLTFVAQTAPGAVMNTQGGYGNFATFGLPATSNTFTVNGGYENDPFLNVNNSGASNLLLGNNDVSEVNIISNAYAVQYGGLGGSQVNEISRSGSNAFHGNATYFFDGSFMNANDFFNNQNNTPRPPVHANQWAAAVGGPIIKDKTFFFVNTEGLRVLIPSNTTVFAPSPAFQASTIAANPNAASFYQKLFSSYTSSPNYANHVADQGDPNAVTYTGSTTNLAKEWIITGRIDQKLWTNDNLFGHFEVDRGVQPTHSDAVNTIFNADSPQPQYGGQLNETHTFSPNITNQFIFAELWYHAVFANTNAAAANALVPFTLFFLDGDLANTGLGGDDYVFPQGRNVEGYQFIDDLSINKGNHTIKLGWSIRRDDITDYGPQVLTTPLVETTEGDFAADIADVFVQQFPTRPTQPVTAYNMGAYVQDQWKATPNLTITGGIRFEHNSNFTCLTNCFANANGDFGSLPTATTTPYDQEIASGRHRAFITFQHVGYEPRIGFAYLPFGPGSRTTIRGGYGIFADAFPGQLADTLLNNAPGNVGFELLGGTPFGTPGLGLDPYLAGSNASVAASSNAAFQSAYKAGGSLNSISAAVPAFAPPSLYITPHHISYPTYNEYSLAIEHQLNRSTAFSLNYVGNHGYKEPVQNEFLNSYAGSAFVPGTIPNGNFGEVTEVYSGASSNYNGAYVSVIHQSKSLTLQANYTYSHALDEISNGGFDGFSGNSVLQQKPGDLAANYGNADYDTRHYVNGSYIYTIPHYRGPKELVDNWQFSGTVFHSNGLPFTPTATSPLTNNTGVNPFAAGVVGKGNTHCGGTNHVFNRGTGAPVGYCGYSTEFTQPTDYGQTGRNQIFGPKYTDTDLSILKGFTVPHWETGKFQVGVQMFNLFNHPNFGQPNATCSPSATSNSCNAGNSLFGTINGTVNPPTSILGSFLGGDASPRLIQFKGSFSF